MKLRLCIAFCSFLTLPHIYAHVSYERLIGQLKKIENVNDITHLLTRIHKLFKNQFALERTTQYDFDRVLRYHAKIMNLVDTMQHDHILIARMCVNCERWYIDDYYVIESLSDAHTIIVDLSSRDYPGKIEWYCIPHNKVVVDETSKTIRLVPNPKH